MMMMMMYFVKLLNNYNTIEKRQDSKLLQK